jgi:hypothetical protein
MFINGLNWHDGTGDPPDGCLTECSLPAVGKCKKGFRKVQGKCKKKHKDTKQGSCLGNEHCCRDSS